MTFRRLLVAAVALPMLSACVSNDTIGTAPEPTMFTSYVALGTSLGAGIMSGGINDTTQLQTYPALLATSMGLTPGQSWLYPALTLPGCPPPYADIRTSTRIAAVSCALRAAASAAPYMHNVSIPGIRLVQALDLNRLDFSRTDTLGLAVFITGGRNPVDVMDAAHPTFVSVELGANDALGAATRGDTTYLTRADSFAAQYTRLADRVAATGAMGVVLSNVPQPSRAPHFTRGTVFFCLATGACPGVPATAPFNSARFLISPTCAPAAASGLGDSYLVTFSATATIAGVLNAGGYAKLNCAYDTIQVNTGAGFASAGASLNPTELATITARVNAFNTTIASIATAHSWALADLDSTLLANAAQVPSMPNLTTTTPATLFGALFSQDGIHPNAAGYALMATMYKAAINRKYGTSLQ